MLLDKELDEMLVTAVPITAKQARSLRQAVNDMSLFSIMTNSQWRDDIPAGLSLRSELSVRSLKHASAHGYLHERTDGEIPSILFGCDERGRHGNFHPDSYRSICATPPWAKRLEKAHTAYRRVRVRANWCWKELDCSNSSDALLMNIFCYPAVTAMPVVRGVLGNESLELPVFGFKPRIPLISGRYDNTEIDMRLGRLLVEAKLTESDFQVADSRLVLRYRHFETVFDSSELALRKKKHVGYQLIRGVLAAYAGNFGFCVFCDARRPDLIEVWFSVMRAVRLFDLRCRLKLLTWQELAGVLPSDLQDFLALKYGILPS
jgi:hypothetical protein